MADPVGSRPFSSALGARPSVDSAPMTATAPTSAPALATPLGPAPALPRASVGEAMRHSGLRHPAIAGVLFGVQGVGALIGAPAVAHAADLPAATPETLATRLADLEARRDTMSPSELAAARRAVFREFVSVAAQATSYPFETEWTQAQPGTVSRASVADALKTLGAEGTEAKLLELHAKYADKLAPDARADLEVAIAGRALDAAAADGTLDAADVTGVETKLQGKLGEEAGSRAVLRAFPTHLDVLDDGAAAHLLSRASALATHSARAIALVEEALDGKNALVDVNADGKLDAGDVVLTETAAGKHLAARVTKRLADETRVSEAMVNAAETMHGSGISFALIKDHRANPDFWTVDDGGVLRLKPGVKPSEAMIDMAKNGNKYGFECATGLVATYYHAMLEMLGPTDFDRVMMDLEIGPWRNEDDLAAYKHHYSPNTAADYETPLGDKKLTPGNYYYFRNWDVTDEARARGWQGENVIYLGGGKFYGHGIGLGDGSMFIAKLSSEMKPGGQTPSLLNLTAYLSTDVLDLDQNPGQ